MFVGPEVRAIDRILVTSDDTTTDEFYTYLITMVCFIALDPTTYTCTIIQLPLVVLRNALSLSARQPQIDLRA